MSSDPLTDAIFDEAAVNRRLRDRLRSMGWRKVERDLDGARYHRLADELAKAGFVRAKKPVYLRFGKPPRTGRSALGYKDHEERGVSAFSGRFTAEGHYILQLTNPIQRLDLIRCCAIEKRRAYFLRGRVVGRGAAGEPLLGRIGSVERVGPGCIVAVSPSSRALEAWNEQRGVDLVAPFRARSSSTRER